MGLAFLGIWIIFSTIAAPTIIQHTITNGISAASSLFSGGFAAGSAAGTAGMMSLAGSIGGKSVSMGKDDLSKEGLKKAASAGIYRQLHVFARIAFNIHRNALILDLIYLFYE